MVTVIKRYEDADVMAFDYFIEAHHDVYEDTGHIVMKSSGGMETWRAVNDGDETYLKTALTALFERRDENGGVYPEQVGAATA